MDNLERMEDLILRTREHRIGSWKHWHLRGRAARYAKRVGRRKALAMYARYRMMPPLAFF